MTDSSRNRPNIFGGLRFRHVTSLLAIINDSDSGDRANVRKLFLEEAEGFDETIAFLTRLSLIKNDSGKLRLGIEWPRADVQRQHAIVLDHLCRIPSRYRSEVLRFIGRFKMLAEDLVYFSSVQSRSSESPVRNFLMDMAIVRHEPGTARYTLSPEYISLYARAKDANYNMTQMTLIHGLDSKGEIGARAELKVLTYEQERLGNNFSHKIHHVSRCNVAAGYDIRSVTVTGSNRITPRFIEVKAVSNRNFQFHWSQNEVAVARSLSHWYYLYLLPVDRHGSFDMSKLQEIPDPYRVVFEKDSGWAYESGVLRCYWPLSQI